jgi:hypothetical protein
MSHRPAILPQCTAFPHLAMVRSFIRRHRTVTGRNKQNGNNKGDKQTGSTHDDFFYFVKKSNLGLPHKVE